MVQADSIVYAGPGQSVEKTPLGESKAMASRLGPSWLKRVKQLAGPTHAGRMGRYALLVERINGLEPQLEACTPEELLARAHKLRLRARQGDSLNSLLVEAFAM